VCYDYEVLALRQEVASFGLVANAILVLFVIVVVFGEDLSGLCFML